MLSELKEEELEASQIEESKDISNMNHSQINKSGMAQSILMAPSTLDKILPKSGEAVRERSLLSELHKRGKVRDIQAKKVINDIKLNLEK